MSRLLKPTPKSGWLMRCAVPAVNFGITCEYDVPDDVFMVRELRKGALRGITGTVKYHQVFREVEQASRAARDRI